LLITTFIDNRECKINFNLITAVATSQKFEAFHAEYFFLYLYLVGQCCAIL